VKEFEGLARAAQLAPGADTHDRLWSAMFALPAWHFVKSPSPSGWLPASGYVNGLRCVLGFTEAIYADGYARLASLLLPGVDTPVLSLAPEAIIQLVPRLRAWGTAGIVFDNGPFSFYTPLDALFAMRLRYRAAAQAPAPARVPPPAAAATRGPTRGLNVENMLALQTWYLVTTVDDPSFPELAFHGTELVAQIYTSPQVLARRSKPGATPPPMSALAPAAVLDQLADIELVGIVRFDGELDVPFVDLKLRAG
jgi:hypothetical protein